MENIPFVMQYSWEQLQQSGFPLKGKWNDFFNNDNPIVLELGCGKGEYTVGLGKINPDKNYIGIDIKGARMWTGATEALHRDMKNIAFIRTGIEFLPYFFDSQEVDEIWITFPDPQMQKAGKRLTGTRMLKKYREVLKKNGMINLKTDSPFLYNYTKLMCESNNITLCCDSNDIYSDREGIGMPIGLREIQTHYEKQWIDRGLTIKFLSFSIVGDNELEEPDGAQYLEKDTYRSYSRGHIQMPQILPPNE